MPQQALFAIEPDSLYAQSELEPLMHKPVARLARARWAGTGLTYIRDSGSVISVSRGAASWKIPRTMGRGQALLVASLYRKVTALAYQGVTVSDRHQPSFFGHRER